MVNCKTLAIPSVLSTCAGVLGFGWLIVDTERGNNRFRWGVGITSLALVTGGGMGLLYWVTNTCESDTPGSPTNRT